MGRVKGAIFLPLVKAVRKSVPNARELLPPELHGYLEHRILVSEWYPEEDHLVLLRVCAKSLGMTNVEPFGYVLAQEELGGVYRSSLIKGSARRTLRAFAKLWPQNHDTGQMVLAEPSWGATLTLTDYAHPATEVCQIVTGYIVEGLRMSSDKTFPVRHRRCRANLLSQECVWDIELPPTKSANGDDALSRGLVARNPGPRCAPLAIDVAFVRRMRRGSLQDHWHPKGYQSRAQVGRSLRSSRWESTRSLPTARRIHRSIRP